MSILDGYIEELEMDTRLDEFTVRDAQMKLPGIKHKWVGRLMRAKLNNGNLYRKRASLINQLTEKLIKESHVKLSLPMAKSKVESHEVIVELTNEIAENNIIIEFLEKAEKIFNSMTFDIKNLTEIMKLETQ